MPERVVDTLALARRKHEGGLTLDLRAIALIAPAARNTAALLDAEPLAAVPSSRSRRQAAKLPSMRLSRPELDLSSPTAAAPAPPGVVGLGRCLLQAAALLFDAGYGALALLNADGPTLPPSLLLEATRLCSCCATAS